MKRLPALFLSAACLFLISPSLLYSQTTAYFPNFGDDNVKRVFSSDETFASVGVCTEPYGAAVTPNGGNLIVTCQAGKSVVLIPTGTFTSENTQLEIAIENDQNEPQPRGVAVESRGLFAYAADFANDTVTEINITTRTIGRTIDLDEEQPQQIGPWGVAAFYDSTDKATKVYVTNHDGNSISVITLDEEETDPVVSTFGAIGLDGPIGAALTPDGARLYVADNGNKRVVVFDTADESIIERITVGTGPWGVAMASGGDFVFVSNNESASVSVIETSNRRVTGTHRVGIQPTGVAAPINGDFAYVVNQEDGTIKKITTTGEVTLVNDSATDGDDELNGAFSLGAFIGGSPPETPSGLEATMESSGTISLDWTDNANDELGYRIERRKDSEEEEEFVQVDTTDEGETTYTDNSLARGTTYEYRVRAFNEVASSDYSSTASATTNNEQFSWCFIHTLLYH